MRGAAVLLALLLAAVPAAGDDAATGDESALAATIRETRESLTYRSDDGEAWLRAGGLLQIDATRYGHANRRHDGVSVSAARVAVLGGTGILDARLELDADGTDTRHPVAEAWLRAAFDEALRVRAGWIRQPLSSELATREEDLPLPGYGFTSHLTGRRAPGVEVAGELFGRALHYEVSSTLGHGWGVAGDHMRSDRTSGRVVVHPLRGAVAGASPWHTYADGLWAGAAYAVDDDFDDPVVVSTPLESTVFRSPRLDGDGGRWLVWEVGLAAGPWRLSLARADGTAEDVPDGRGGRDDLDQLTAWTAQASWNLTGGRTVAEAGAWRTERAEEYGPWGDWELAARYSNADIDRKLFELGIVPPGLATQEVRTGTFSVAWRPAEGLRLLLAYVNTIADEPLVTFGGTRRDHSVVLRLELSF